METGTHSPITDELSLDATFRLLRDPRRRALVSILADLQQPVALSRLAAAVAERELETDEEVSLEADDVPPETVESVAAVLHHNHLPKLDDGGLVTYDPVEKTVTSARVEGVAPITNPDDDGT